MGVFAVPFSLTSYIRGCEIKQRIEEWEKHQANKNEADEAIPHYETEIIRIRAIPEEDYYDYHQRWNMLTNLRKCEERVHWIKKSRTESMDVLCRLSPQLRDDWLDVLNSELVNILLFDLVVIVAEYLC